MSDRSRRNVPRTSAVVVMSGTEGCASRGSSPAATDTATATDRSTTTGRATAYESLSDHGQDLIRTLLRAGSNDAAVRGDLIGRASDAGLRLSVA